MLSGNGLKGNLEPISQEFNFPGQNTRMYSQSNLDSDFPASSKLHCTLKLHKTWPVTWHVLRGSMSRSSPGPQPPPPVTRGKGNPLQQGSINLAGKVARLRAPWGRSSLSQVLGGGAISSELTAPEVRAAWLAAPLVNKGGKGTGWRGSSDESPGG